MPPLSHDDSGNRERTRRPARATIATQTAINTNCAPKPNFQATTMSPDTARPKIDGRTAIAIGRDPHLAGGEH